ncbi:MAG: prepilin-type N-terminal cleavage/methylation domain-containing protein, partial [Parcubacteria group bacterium]|nr:prepilin-type N-terminal cleavage/methylation domain-containing protein [Parcubacteria group bacterium]
PMLSFLKKFISRHQKAFTFVELLIVTAIIAILATVVIVILNPVELLKKTRDSQRISDSATLKRAISIYELNTSGTGQMGSVNTIYLSLSDTSSTCASWTAQLPTLTSPWIYNCVTQANLLKTDGSGWLPQNFSSLAGGSPISSLPIDPVNNASNYYFYTYNSQYEFNAKLESNELSSLTYKDGGDDDSLYEIGTKLSILPAPFSGNIALFNQIQDQLFAFNQIAYAQGAPSSGQVAFFTDSTHLNGDNGLFWDNTNKRLGIGTTSPSSQLEIKGTSVFKLTGTTPKIFLSYTGGSLNGPTIQTSLEGSDDLYITPANSNVPAMTIYRTSGNVGIGTTAPSSPLHIRGPEISGSGQLLVESSLNSAVVAIDAPLNAHAGVLFKESNASKWYLAHRGDIDDSFRLYGYDSGAYIFTINSSGNVGIGTTTISTSQKLEINGGIALNTVTAKPTCSSTTRGTFWATQNGVGVKDNVEVCAKDAANAYAWRTIY